MKRIDIRVPASSGNIGVGFDVLGMALDLYNDFTFTTADVFSVDSGFEEYDNENHLAYRVFCDVLRRENKEIPAIHLTANCDIPPARGLASSGSCIIAGVIAGLYFSGKELNRETVISLASEYEGHPDNIVSQVLGGVTASMEEEKLFYKKTDTGKDLNCLAVVPDYKLSTKQSRSVLPKEIPVADAVSNMGQAIFLLDAFERRDYKDLKFFLNDHIHQVPRSKNVKYFDDIVKIALEHGAYGAYLSGAGPTIMIFTDPDNGEPEKKILEFLRKKKEIWQILNLKIDNRGVGIRIRE